MCGRFALDHSTDAVVAWFLATTNRFPEWVPSWNIAPTSTIPLLVTTASGERILAPARWSLVPSWSKELTLKYPTFNARSETAAAKPTFRDSLSSQRCIIPITGYYEFSSTNGTKAPYFIHQPEQSLVGLAGLYSWWTNPDTGVLLATTTILTRDSAGTLTSLHDRMPLAVEHEDVQRWLDPTITGGAELIAEISRKAEKSQDQWEFYEVSPLRGDGPHLIHKLGSD